MRDARPPKHVSTLLSVAMLVASGGCANDDYDRAAHEQMPVTSTPDDTAYFFESARPLTSVTRASWLDKMPSISKRYWPVGLYEDYRKHRNLVRGLGARAPSWPRKRFDQLRFEPFKRMAETRYMRFGDLPLYFVGYFIRGHGGKDATILGGAYHQLALLVMGDDPKEFKLGGAIEGPHVDRPLDYDVAVQQRTIVLIYASKNAIWEIVGTSATGDLQFTRARRIREAPLAPGDIRLIQAEGGLHLFWTHPSDDPDAGRLVMHARRDVSGKWSDGDTVAAMARDRSLNAAVIDGRILLAWIDHRSGRKPGDRGPIVATVGLDDAMGFGPPILLSRKSASDDAERLHVVAYAHGATLFWTDRDFETSKSWNRACIEADLAAVRHGEPIPDDRLHAAYANRMTAVIQAMDTEHAVASPRGIAD